MYVITTQCLEPFYWVEKRNLKSNFDILKQMHAYPPPPPKLAIFRVNGEMEIAKMGFLHNCTTPLSLFMKMILPIW